VLCRSRGRTTHTSEQQRPVVLSDRHALTLDELVACLAVGGLTDARTAGHAAWQDSVECQAATVGFVSSYSRCVCVRIPVVSFLHSLDAEVGERYRGIIPRHATSAALIIELGVDALQSTISSVRSPTSC
jgi:hypothetical protein